MKKVIKVATIIAAYEAVRFVIIKYGVPYIKEHREKLNERKEREKQMEISSILDEAKKNKSKDIIQINKKKSEPSDESCEAKTCKPDAKPEPAKPKKKKVGKDKETADNE